MGGVLKNALVGKQLMDEGHVWRGVETMLPKGLKDGMKGVRYATEGVNNLRGDAVIEDVSLRQALLQFSGFTPAEVSRQYQLNNALKNYEDHITSRRKRLMDAFAMANRTGDQQGRSDTVTAIQAFNRTHPQIAITTSTIGQSLMARARHSASAEGGIMLNKKLANKLRTAVGVE